MRQPGLAICLGSFLAASTPFAQVAVTNDYPTVVRADYVFGCMASNGNTRPVLEKCSCSIDVIASIIPYDTYVEAETILSMRQVSGERMAIFRTSPQLSTLVADLRRAQAEAEIRCF